jgi:hypothetical protein
MTALYDASHCGANTLRHLLSAGGPEPIGDSVAAATGNAHR